MAVTVLDRRLLELVDAEVEVEQIAAGFAFTEGPVWNAADASLTFSDIYDDHNGTLYRWTERDGLSVFRRPSEQANGNTLDAAGRLVTCHQHSRRISRTHGDGSVETLAGAFDGKRFNSPNDIVALANGDLIFTDPMYGLRRPDGSFAPSELGFAGVFRRRADGRLELLTDDCAAPNGLVLGDRGRRLLVADTQKQHVRAFAVGDDGRLSGGEVLVDVSQGETAGRPDGMKLDERGNLYVTANTDAGVSVFAPDGALLGFIGLGGPPANCAWGGNDRRTLYATARDAVYRLRLKVAGQPLQPDG